MAQIKGSLNLLTRHLKSKRSRTLDTCKSIYKNLQGSNITTKNAFASSNTQIRFYAKETAGDKKTSKDYYANINAEWEKQKGKIEADLAEKEKKGPGRISRFWDSMTGGKEEFKRKSEERKAFKASREKLEEDRAERQGRGYKQDLRDKQKTRQQDVEELSFNEKWKKMKEARRKRSERSIYERFFIQDWMLHPTVLIGTDYTNMDFWWDGNSSNQLTLYQERSDLVNKLMRQQWGHKRSEIVRNVMRDKEKKRDDLRVKTEPRNPLVGDDKWQDRPFWMRSAMVLDSVYPVLEKQAMNLYDLKEAEQDSADMRFIWEKQEEYVESLKITRDLKALMVKNPIPDEVHEVVDFPIPRRITPEMSRKIEKEMFYSHTLDEDPIADWVEGLKQGKPMPYGPDFDLNKTYDKYNLPVHYPELDKAVAKFEEKLRKQREFNPDDYETEEEREKARKHFEGMAELEKFINERRVFLERKHLEEFQEREGISLDSIKTYTEEELAYEVERQLAFLTDQPFEKEQPLSWEQLEKKKALEAKAAAAKPPTEGAATDATGAATTEGAAATNAAATDPNAAAQGGAPEPPPAQMVVDTTPDEDDPAAKLKAEAKRRKEAAKKAAAAKPKPMTKEVLKLFPDAEEQAKRLKFAEEDDDEFEGEDDWIEEMWEEEYKNTPKFTPKELEFRKIMAQGVEIDMLKLRREGRIPISAREPETVIDRMWQKWLDKEYDVAYTDPIQTCKDLTEFALKPPLIDVVVIKKFIEDQLTKTNGILRPYHATKIEVMMKYREQVRMYMDQRIYMIPRKILIYNQQQVLQEDEDGPHGKKVKNTGFTTAMSFDLMNLLELARAGEAIEGERFAQGNYSGVTYEWHAPMTRLEDRFIFGAYLERISHRMQSLGNSELVRTNDGIKIPANFNHDHFPNPYSYEWQNPQGLSEPDEAHIVNPHVGEHVHELLYGSYPEAIIEQMEERANRSNLIDMGLSGIYRKMARDIRNWYIPFRERERIDDNKDESRYFFKMLEHFRPGYNHSDFAWEQGRRMPIWRVKMEEDEVEAFTMRGKTERRAFPGDATREYTIQLTKPIYDEEFVETMFKQNEEQVISDYVQSLVEKAKPQLFDYITTPENVYYDFHHRVKITENPNLHSETEIKPPPKKFTADFLKTSTPEQIQKRIDEYRKTAELGTNVLEQPPKSENYKLRMTFEKIPAIPINRFMWQWDYRADTRERFETPFPSSEHVMELYHYEEMQQRYERALVNNTEVVDRPLPYSREKRRQALLLTQPNLKFADELVYSASTFSSDRANHFMQESILAPIDKYVYGPLRDIREKIKAGLVKEAEAILMETERKALKMTPHEYYVERKSRSQKEEELARGTIKRLTPEEEEQWKLQLQQKFDDFNEAQNKDVKDASAEVDSKQAALDAIRERIRKFHEESSKIEEQEEERALRSQKEDMARFKDVGINSLFAKDEGTAVKTVEKGVPEPEEVQDPVLRSDDTQILIQLKREPEDFEPQLAEGSEATEDSGMTVSSKGDGRQETPADKEAAYEAKEREYEDADKSREEPRQEPRSEFNVSGGAAPFANTQEAPKEEPIETKAQEEPVQPQEFVKTQEEPVKTQTETRAEPRAETRTETRTEDIEEARARTAEFAEQIREEAATRAKRMEANEERMRSEERDQERVDVDEEVKAQARDRVDPRDLEDHERVDIAERSEDTELDRMQEAETRTKFEQRREKREQEKEEAEKSRVLSVFESFFNDEKSLAQLEAEKMLAEHQQQIDESTGFKGLIKANKEQQAKKGAFGLSLRSSPEGGVGRVKEAAATAFNEDIRKRISNFDLRIFAKTFTPIAFHALGAFVKGDLANLAELCSKDLLKKLANDWKKLRAIGIETLCEVTSKGKPKLVAAMPGKVEDGIELPPMLTFSISIRFKYWVTYHGKTIAGGPDFINKGKCLVTACLNKDDKFEIMEMDVQNKRLSAANDMFINELVRIKEEREAESEGKAKEANAAEAERVRAEQQKQREEEEQKQQKEQQKQEAK